MPVCNKNGCGCSGGANLTLIDGGKGKEQCQHKKVEIDAYGFLVQKSIQIYQQFEEGELSKERALGYLTAMEDIIKISWGGDNLLLSVQKLIKEVENY